MDMVVKNRQNGLGKKITAEIIYNQYDLGPIVSCKFFKNIFSLLCV